MTETSDPKAAPVAALAKAPAVAAAAPPAPPKAPIVTPVFDAARTGNPTIHGEGGLQAIIQDGHKFSPSADHEYLGEYDQGKRPVTVAPLRREPLYTEEKLNGVTWRQIHELMLKHGGTPQPGPAGRKQNVAWLISNAQ